MRTKTLVVFSAALAAVFLLFGVWMGKGKKEKIDRGEVFVKGIESVEILAPGEGTPDIFVQPMDKVFVHYKEYLEGERKIEDTRANLYPPLKIFISAGDVVAGLDLGLRGARLGSTRKISLEPQFAYGARGNGKRVPPHSRIVFEVEVLEIAKHKKNSGLLRPASQP